MATEYDKLNKRINWLRDKYACLLAKGCCDDNTITIPPQIERTSELINDGENGFDPFITASDIPDFVNENTILDGSIYWVEGLTFRSTPLIYRFDGVIYNAPITTLVLSDADSVLDRIDVFAVNTNNQVIVIEGTPSNDPQEPTVDFTSQLRVSAVFIPAGATEPQGFSREQVYNENTEEPIEWTNNIISSVGGTPSTQVVFNSTVSPSRDTLSIETFEIAKTTTIEFVNDTLIDFETISSLAFDFKAKVTLENVITIRLYNGTQLIRSTVLNNGENGFSGIASILYDTVNIPKSEFLALTRPVSTEFNRITFNFDKKTKIGTSKLPILPSFFMDDIRILFGGETSSEPGTFLALTDVFENTYNGQAGKVPVVNTEETGLEFQNFPSQINPIGATEIQLEKFGARGDGIQLYDFDLTGTNLYSLSASFSVEDEGKIVSIANAGTDGLHLVTTISQFVDFNNVILSDSAITDVTSQIGSYGTENTTAIENALVYGMENNVKITAKEGVYLIGSDSTAGIEIIPTADNQNIFLDGKGEGLTIFRELDGRTQRFGRFTRLFKIPLNHGYDIGFIKFSNFTLDKNGRSLSTQPPTLFEWEQAHAFSIYDVNNASNTENIKSIEFENIEIYDKIGAGLNGTGLAKYGRVRMRNITESGFRLTRPENIVYGQRGDVEMSLFSDDMQLTELNLRYMQIEPTNTLKTTSENRRNMNITNSKIDNLEYSELGTGENEYHVLTLNSVKSNNFLIRGITLYATNCDLKISRLINSINGNITNSTVRVEYDEVSNTIQGIQCAYLASNPSQPNKFTFDGVDFLIDSNDETIEPNGNMVFASSFNSTAIDKNIVTFRNCSFDSRVQGSIDAYAGGTWYVENCKIAGRDFGIEVGGFTNNFSYLYLKDNDWNLCQNRTILLRNSNTLWKVSMDESFDKDDYWNVLVTGVVGDLETQIVKFPKFLLDSLDDRVNYHLKGSEIIINQPELKGVSSYICVESGTTGVYASKTFLDLSYNDYTGWGSYEDTVRVDSATALVLSADTKIDLPNNAGTIIESQLPYDISTFYDGTTIKGKYGDAMSISISFAVKPTTSSVTSILTVPDIGGAIGEIKEYEVNKVFSKGNGIIQRYLAQYDCYIYDTWEANGATIKIESDQPCEIFNIRYYIVRKHKGR